MPAPGRSKPFRDQLLAAVAERSIRKWNFGLKLRLSQWCYQTGAGAAPCLRIAKPQKRDRDIFPTPGMQNQK